MQTSTGEAMADTLAEAAKTGGDGDTKRRYALFGSRAAVAQLLARG